jgi:hypothetical protein
VMLHPIRSGMNTSSVIHAEERRQISQRFTLTGNELRRRRECVWSFALKIWLFVLRISSGTRFFDV